MPIPVETQRLTLEPLEWFYREAKGDRPTDRPPVVLLHGLPSQSYGWRHILPALAEAGFWAIAPDWIGAGFSCRPDLRDFAYTPAAFEQALGDFLDGLGLERVSLVVQGFLGSVGVRYALNHPDRIDRLVIANAPVFPEAKLPWRIQQLGLPLAGDMLTQDPLLVDRTLEGGGQYRVEDADLDVYRRPFLQSSDAGRSLLATVRRLKVKPEAAAIAEGLASWDKPVLMLWGATDPWLPVDMARAFTQTLPQGKFVALDEVGHYPQEDWHEKVTEAILPFLRQMAI